MNTESTFIGNVLKRDLQARLLKRLEGTGGPHEDTQKPDFGYLANRFDKFSADNGNFDVYAQLDSDDQVALIRGLPLTKVPVEAFTALGWLEFCGNQWNENWRWSEGWLDQLRSTGRLAAFYAFAKNIKLHLAE